MRVKPNQLRGLATSSLTLHGAPHCPPRAAARCRRRGRARITVGCVDSSRHLESWCGAPAASSETLCARPAPGGATLIAHSLRVARTTGARAEKRRVAARPRGRATSLRCMKIDTTCGCAESELLRCSASPPPARPRALIKAARHLPAADARRPRGGGRGHLVRPHRVPPPRRVGGEGAGHGAEHRFMSVPLGVDGW